MTNSSAARSAVTCGSTDRALARARHGSNEAGISVCSPSSAVGAFGLVYLLTCALAQPALAQSLADVVDRSGDPTEPLWEVGALIGGGRIPDFPAADESSSRALVLPFAIYRGPIFKLGDGGAARGVLSDDGTIEIDLGLDAAFPVDSDDNDAREGMDNLDYLLELGPRVTYRFLPKGGTHEVDLSLATRAVISTDGANWRYQGFTINPALVYRRNDLFDRDLRATLAASPLFGFDGINRYFYRVGDGDARPDRPAFDAEEGYIGTEFSAGLSVGLFGRVRLFGGVQVGYWDGAANDDSPLHGSNTTLAVGGGLRWSIFQSSERVPR